MNKLNFDTIIHPIKTIYEKNKGYSKRKTKKLKNGFFIGEPVTIHVLNPEYNQKFDTYKTQYYDSCLTPTGDSTLFFLSNMEEKGVFSIGITQKKFLEYNTSSVTVSKGNFRIQKMHSKVTLENLLKARIIEEE